MKRMTIFRFNGLAFGVVAATVATAPALDAQEPQAPRTHLVQRGETLWTLAEYYFGDPLLWPRIYRINTTVVEDPHWIFPGEQLFLLEAPDATVVTVETPEGVRDQPDMPPAVTADTLMPEAAPPPPPPPTTAQSETIFAQNRPRATMIRAVRSRAPTGRISRSHFYSAGFLTEENVFPWAEVRGASGQLAVNALVPYSSANLNEKIRLVAPVNASYRVGDSLLVARIQREIPGWGEVVLPSGIVEVTSVIGRDVEAKIIMQFDVITEDQVAMPAEPFSGQYLASETVPIQNGLAGQIIGVKDRDVVSDLQDVVFLDRGRNDGVSLGDEFNVMVSQEGFAVPDRTVAVLRVVHVRDRSASAMVVRMADIGVETGAYVRMARKATQ